MSRGVNINGRPTIQPQEFWYCEQQIDRWRDQWKVVLSIGSLKLKPVMDFYGTYAYPWSLPVRNVRQITKGHYLSILRRGGRV